MFSLRAGAKVVSWVKEYELATWRATREAFTEAAKLVATTARRYAPRARKHRDRRSYPGGRHYSGERRISQSIRYKVKDAKRRDWKTVFALVRVTVGYGVFLEYGTRFMKRAKGALSFTRRALADRQADVFRALKGKWPQ